MTEDDRLAHALKLKFGLAPHEPTSWQLQSIKAAIARIKSSGRLPTDAEWRAAVAISCPGIGQHVYAGVDNSDLNTLLALATQAAGGRG